MSLKVIELNDTALRVGDESGIIVQSPGFALAAGNTLELGDAAEQQARLQPTNSYNKYWHELSMEPLSHGNGIRHFADIAYAHLLHLAELGAIDSDVIFAVPGNFTRQQLAILLGLAKQSPFTAVGVVDSALAAAIKMAESGPLIYADIQLHQVLLTKLTVSGSELKTDSIVQVPGVGNQNFMDSMMQMATGMFIQQCRFNPQHNAESEQQLYNELPRWLEQNDDKSSLLLKLQTPSAVHTAKMPKESMINHLAGHYQKIARQITALAPDANTQLLISSGLAALPGFTETLKGYPQLQILSPQVVNEACFDYRGEIAHGADNIHLINCLPVNVRASTATAIESAAPVATPSDAAQPTEQAQAGDDYRAPTHVLYDNRALAISEGNGLAIENQTQRSGNAASSGALILSLLDLPEQLGRIVCDAGQVWLETGASAVKLNDQEVSGRHKLTIGDSLSYAAGSDDIRLIQVAT